MKRYLSIGFGVFIFIILSLPTGCTGPVDESCGSDQDCKGERVCKGGNCVDPKNPQKKSDGVQQDDGGVKGDPAVGKDEQPKPDKAAPPNKCNGDWTLGSTFVKDTSAGIGHACSKGFKNCRDGTFIRFPDGRCVCILSCSSLVGKKVGDNCTKDGVWKCRHIKATNANQNQGKVCVPDQWNLCQAGGTGPGPGPKKDAGILPEKTCKAIGQACAEDEECCSDSCDLISNTCES